MMNDELKKWKMKKKINILSDYNSLRSCRCGASFISYTQVDLSLTLSRATIVQAIQKSFSMLGL